VIRAAALACVALFCLPPATATAGAWLQAPRAGFYKLSWLGQSSDERWDCRGDEIAADSAGRYEQWQLFGYGEYGLLPWLTLTGSWVYKDQRIDGEVRYGTRSSGDLRLGARLPLLRLAAPLSVEAILSLPTYERSDLSDAPADRPQYLPAGSGRVEGELHLLAGTSLWPLPLYFNGDLGFRRRGGDFVDQWLGVLEIGSSTPRLFVKSELRLAIPTQEQCSDENEALGTVALAERNLALGAEAAIRLHRTLWFSAGYARPLSGRNSLVSGVFSVGLALWAGG
jgi:hypothetical protein